MIHTHEAFEGYLAFKVNMRRFWLEARLFLALPYSLHVMPFWKIFWLKYWKNPEGVKLVAGIRPYSRSTLLSAEMISLHGGPNRYRGLIARLLVMPALWEPDSYTLQLLGSTSKYEMRLLKHTKPESGHANTSIAYVA